MALTISKSSPQFQRYSNGVYARTPSRSIHMDDCGQLCRFVHIEIEVHTVQECEFALVLQHLIERVNALRKFSFVGMLLRKGHGFFGHQFQALRSSN